MAKLRFGGSFSYSEQSRATSELIAMWHEVLLLIDGHRKLLKGSNLYRNCHLLRRHNFPASVTTGLLVAHLYEGSKETAVSSFLSGNLGIFNFPKCANRTQSLTPSGGKKCDGLCFCVNAHLGNRHPRGRGLSECGYILVRIPQITENRAQLQRKTSPINIEV